jgi:DNA-binding response OmpR family regulator
MNDYISKPVQINELLEALANHCGGSLAERSQTTARGETASMTAAPDASPDELPALLRARRA